MAKTNVNFDKILGVISILGFITIIVKASAGVDISIWVESLLFMIMGVALFLSGGYKLLLKYFQGGVTWDELNKIVSVVVGFFSMLLGILMIPVFNLDLTIFNGVKIIIAFIAIFVIGLEMATGQL